MAALLFWAGQFVAAGAPMAQAPAAAATLVAITATARIQGGEEGCPCDEGCRHAGVCGHASCSPGIASAPSPLARVNLIEARIQVRHPDDRDVRSLLLKRDPPIPRRIV